MIARYWKGIAFKEKANDYETHLERSVLPELERIDGFRGYRLLRRDVAEDVEFVVLTLWESMEAIRKFAGENADTAVVAPEARGLFRKYDSEVKHYEIILGSDSAG